MGLFKWHERYSVGITRMDEHHQKIFALANQLYDSMNKHDAKNVVIPIIGELVEYTQYHFKEEEKLMEKANYVGLADQKFEHDKLISRINEMKEQALTGELGPVVIELSKTISGWLADHILKMDKAYENSLKSIKQENHASLVGNRSPNLSLGAWTPTKII